MSLLGGRFGTVDKAAFRIGKEQNDEGKWEFEAPVEVLLNPSSLKIGTITNMKRDEGVANETTEETASTDGKITPKGVTEEQVDMTLIFNIVEEYKMKTGGAEFMALVSAATSLVGKLINNENVIDSAESALIDLIQKTDFTDLSILNRSLCCYTPLQMAAQKQLPVIFYWGNLIYTGFIQKFQTVFNYFSAQGAPLGAEVQLSICTAVNDKKDRFSVSTQHLVGLVQEGGRLIRSLPGD